MVAQKRLLFQDSKVNTFKVRWDLFFIYRTRLQVGVSGSGWGMEFSWAQPKPREKLHAALWPLALLEYYDSHYYLTTRSSPAFYLLFRHSQQWITSWSRNLNFRFPVHSFPLKGYRNAIEIQSLYPFIHLWLLSIHGWSWKTCSIKKHWIWGYHQQCV